ncbi:hypothetical protein FGIG_05916 [Fasciola gigantica]|uniref:Uncharacterized protein n=1 Tax=Fasciola gigantica TaxID=46835 RepID=A0A504YN01_FASGI|nr:hypothetical protein FGIG_05916 [Fasciola gigantica]
MQYGVHVDASVEPRVTDVRLVAQLNLCIPVCVEYALLNNHVNEWIFFMFFKLFNTDDYELAVLQRGHCPFCRTPRE